MQKKLIALAVAGLAAGAAMPPPVQQVWGYGNPTTAGAFGRRTGPSRASKKAKSKIAKLSKRRNRK